MKFMPRTLTAILTAIMIAGVSAGIASAQDITVSGDKLREQNERVKASLATLVNIADKFPELQTALEEKRIEISEAEAEITNTIKDLEEKVSILADNAEYRATIIAFKNDLSNLVAKTKAEERLSLSKQFQQRYDSVDDLDKQRVELVKDARLAIDELKEKQDELVYIRQLANYDEAIAILESTNVTLTDFNLEIRGLTEGIDGAIPAN